MTLDFALAIFDRLDISGADTSRRNKVHQVIFRALQLFLVERLPSASDNTQEAT